MTSPLRRIRNWTREESFRRLLTNAGRLLSANVGASVVSMATALISARALGPGAYGTLALVVAYSLIIGRLASFNSWQALIRIGAKPLADDDREGLGRLIGFALLLDGVSAVLSASLAWVLATPVAGLLGWDAAVSTYLVWTAVPLFLRAEGAPIGTLRLLDRFDLLGSYALIGPMTRLIGTIPCVVFGAGLPVFVAVHLAGTAVGQLWLLGAMLRELHRRGGLAMLSVRPRATLGRFTDLRRYVGSAYVNTILQTASREADEILVAALTGPVALGHFKLAKQIARVLPLLSDPLYQSIYPELARLWTADRRDDVRRLVRRSTAIVSLFAGTIWLGFVLVGSWAIDLAVGAAYAPAYVVTVVYMFAMVLSLLAFSLNPLALAVGRPWSVVRSNAIATLLYFGAAFALIPGLQATGAATAYVIYYVVWSLMMVLHLSPLWRGSTSHAPRG